MGQERHGVRVWCQQKGSRVSHGESLLVRDRFEHYRYKWWRRLVQQAMLFAARTTKQFPVAYELSTELVDFPAYFRSSENRASVRY